MSMPSRARSGRQLLVLLGFVSLFSDLCYEGMRSAIGPYLVLFGASATAVGFVSGLGELVGYGLRYVTGALADRTGKYWALTIAGYSVNLVAVPLLAIAPSWPVVAGLVALERLGKAIRSPAKATLTSFASTELGAGKGFAIHEAMDQLGAMLGPLAVAAVLAWRGSTISGFAWAFALLIIPAIICLGFLMLARARFPDPRRLADAHAAAPAAGVGPGFRWYLVGIALIAIGLADWPLLAYHLGRTGAISIGTLPIVYAAAMAADGVAALVIGWRFDALRARGKDGQGLLALCMVLTAAFAPLVFVVGGSSAAHATAAALLGVLLWSAGLAATESIAKASVATLVAPDQRGRAYGLYYVVFGGAWWLGSIALGVLYDRCPAYAAGFSTAALLAAAVTLSPISRRRAAPRAA